MKKNKINYKFIKDHQHEIVSACIENAKKKAKDAKLLMDSGSYSTAHATLIIALEELAKANLLNKDDFKQEMVGLLLDHKAKASEIMAVSGYCYDLAIRQSDHDWAQKRIPQMREDCLYTRLTETKNNQFCPDDNYWCKRTKPFYNFLQKAIKKVEELIKK